MNALPAFAPGGHATAATGGGYTPVVGSRHRYATQSDRVFSAHAGVSANDFTDDQSVESVAGQSILNGAPVRLRRIGSEPAEPAA